MKKSNQKKTNSTFPPLFLCKFSLKFSFLVGKSAWNWFWIKLLEDRNYYSMFIFNIFVENCQDWNFRVKEKKLHESCVMSVLKAISINRPNWFALYFDIEGAEKFSPLENSLETILIQLTPLTFSNKCSERKISSIYDDMFPNTNISRYHVPAPF